MPSHDEIVRVVGPISDEQAAAIAAAAPSAAELEEAVAWVAGETDVMAGLRRPLSGVVAQIYEILTANEALEDDRDLEVKS